MLPSYIIRQNFRATLSNLISKRNLSKKYLVNKAKSLRIVEFLSTLRAAFVLVKSGLAFKNPSIFTSRFATSA